MTRDEGKHTCEGVYRGGGRVFRAERHERGCPLLSKPVNPGTVQTVRLAQIPFS